MLESHVIIIRRIGIRVDKERLRKETSRQAAATVTTHHVHLFSCKLAEDEMEIARQHAAQVRNVVPEVS